MRSLAGLPSWYLALTIVIVAAGEEWLYRGYAVERLIALTGSGMAAACLSLLAFGLAHLPLWGIGASLTTLVSGALFTGLYLWRRDVSFLILAHVATDLYGLVLAPHEAG
jgi:membrane protease YdiL (CAAX protease family)